MKKRLLKEEGTNAHGFVDDELDPKVTETEDEYQDQDKLIADIQEGDLVDFGPYGKLYVCDISYHKDIFDGDIKFWVTHKKEDRFEKHPQGLSMYAKYATKILEKGSSAQEENDIDASLDKNKYQMPQIAPTQESWSIRRALQESIGFQNKWESLGIVPAWDEPDGNTSHPEKKIDVSIGEDDLDGLIFLKDNKGAEIVLNYDMIRKLRNLMKGYGVQ